MNSIQSFYADKVQLHEKVWQCVAAKYSDENYFGPVNISKPDKPIKDMPKEEYKVHKEAHDKKTEMIKIGYQRIKEKVKSIRQDYSKAVVSGQRNCCGKIVF